MQHWKQQRPDRVRTALRILKHDTTLGLLVAAFLVVSAGVITAARQDHAALFPEFLAPDPGPTEEEMAMAEAEPLAELYAVAPPESLLDVTRGTLEAGQSLAGALAEAGVTPDVVHVITRELRPLFDFRRAQPGHRFRLVRTPEGEMVEFRYEVSDIDRYVLRRVEKLQHDGVLVHEWQAAREEAELEPRVARIAGVVSTSLHEAIVALGERGQLANDFSEIFAWDVDFSRNVQPGDEFNILYERLYLKDEEDGERYVGPGKILAARYTGAAGDFSALYFEPEEGHGGYYRPDGSSVERQFLKAPLRYSRISSIYTQARRHPILNVTRPHQGIDYAAPRGTPLWAVADGKVIYRGWAGGFGNLIKVRHNNGYISYYAHLSRFAKGLKVGQTVSQKQVIGYVGATGLATGPHVCFRIAKDGHYVNPAKVYTPAGDPIPAEDQEEFHDQRDLLLAELGGSSLLGVEEAL
jgi:murein DD-endopeptidase MepM/ murein hydrolase activator NlpD